MLKNAFGRSLFDRVVLVFFFFEPFPYFALSLFSVFFPLNFALLHLSIISLLFDDLNTLLPPLQCRRSGQCFCSIPDCVCPWLFYQMKLIIKLVSESVLSLGEAGQRASSGAVQGATLLHIPLCGIFSFGKNLSKFSSQLC